MNAEISKDILSTEKNRQWAECAARLFENVMNDTINNLSFEQNPQFQVTFDRQSGSAYAGYLPTNLITYVVSYTNLQVGIHENV